MFDIVTSHTMWEDDQDFWCVMGIRHLQGLYLDPRDAEKPYLKILLGAPSEIGASETPSKSHGTKILVSKKLSYQP